MDKTIFEELEKKAIRELKRVAPIVGHWYKISYEQDGRRASRSLRLSFRLCVKIGDHKGPNIYLVGINPNLKLPTRTSVFPDELRFAEWPETNEFHRFCLVMLNIQLGDNPSDINIYDDFKLYIMMETILLPKVINAKNANEAIVEAMKAVEKGTKARLNNRPYGQFNCGIENQKNREEVRKAFEWLVNEYMECKR